MRPQTSLRRLGAQICGLYVEVEREAFSCRLAELLPLLEKEIHPDNYEDVSKPKAAAAAQTPLRSDAALCQIEDEQDERGADRLLFSSLTLLAKLCKHAGLLELSKPPETLCRIWGKAETAAAARRGPPRKR